MKNRYISSFYLLILLFFAFSPLTTHIVKSDPFSDDFPPPYTLHQISKSADELFYLRWTNFTDITEQFAFSNKDIVSPVNSYPIDLNSDDKIDFLIGTEQGGLYYFQNIGSPDNNPNWALNESYNLPDIPDAFQHLSPTAGDLNGDNQIDIVLGTKSGMVYVSYNNNTAMDPVWTNLEPIKDINGNNISFSTPVNPTLANIYEDNDNKLDLLLGTDRILSYENIGTNTSFSYVFDPDYPREIFTQSKISFNGKEGSGDMKIISTKIDYSNNRDDLIFLFASGDYYFYSQLGTVSSPEYIMLNKSETYTTFDFPNIPVLKDIEFEWLDLTNDDYSDLVIFYPDGFVSKAEQYIVIEKIKKSESNVSGFGGFFSLIFFSISCYFINKKRQKNK